MAKANPKSVIRTWPAALSMISAGFRSRCRMPRMCAAENASQSLACGRSRFPCPAEIGQCASTNARGSQRTLGWEPAALRCVAAPRPPRSPAMTRAGVSAPPHGRVWCPARYTSPIPPAPANPRIRRRPADTWPTANRPAVGVGAVSLAGLLSPRQHRSATSAAIAGVLRHLEGTDVAAHDNACRLIQVPTTAVHPERVDRRPLLIAAGGAVSCQQPELSFS